MFALLKLSLREKKWVTLALVATLGVALFNTIFVNLVQPVIDEMFGAAPAAKISAAAPADTAAPPPPQIFGRWPKPVFWIPSGNFLKSTNRISPTLCRS